MADAAQVLAHVAAGEGVGARPRRRRRWRWGRVHSLSALCGFVETLSAQKVDVSREQCPDERQIAVRAALRSYAAAEAAKTCFESRRSRVFSTRITTKLHAADVAGGQASARPVRDWIQAPTSRLVLFTGRCARRLGRPNTHPAARPLKSTGSRVGTMASQGATLQNYNNELVKCALPVPKDFAGKKVATRGGAGRAAPFSN